MRAVRSSNTIFSLHRALELFLQVGSGRSDGLQAYIDDWFKYCQLAKEFIDQFVLAGDRTRDLG